MKQLEFSRNKWFFGICIALICIFSVSSAKSQQALTKALDYDGDGKVDRTVFNPEDNSWYILKSSSGQLIVVQFGLSHLDTPVPGDYDGDGKGDIAVWRESTGVFYYYKSSNGTVGVTQFGMAGDEPVARDYDGDGKTDLAVVRRANGFLIWYYLKSSNNEFVGIQFGTAATDYPAPGDFDGDGRFDLAVQRKEGDYLDFHIMSSRTGAINSFRSHGIADDLFLPGDYDGDGKTDIALARDLGRGDSIIWSIRKSSDNSVQAYPPSGYGDFGLGDFPVQGDYDGDGKTDVAVWRSEDKKFYNLYSSTATQAIILAGSTVDGVLPVAGYDTH